MSFGIDFGTTNSATVELIGSRPQYYGASAERPFPSQIAIDTLTGAVVARGEKVRNLPQEQLDQCEIIINPKRLLGGDYAKRIGGKAWYPEDFVREIFIGLADVVKERSRGIQELKDAVVAVPAGFPAKRRAEIRAGAEEAGVAISGFISEPTAALFQNRDKIDNLRKALVFDWGGGTLDIALLDIDQNQEVSELATSCLELGGSDLDRKIADYLYRPVLEATGIAFHDLPSSKQYRFMSNCEGAKQRLAQTEDAQFVIPDFLPNYTPEASLSRQEMSALLKTECDMAIASLRSILERNRLEWNDIGVIVMVGGSSKLQGLREKIEEISDGCRVISPDTKSDWAVAHGAALLAANPGAYVLSSNIGLELANGELFPLLNSGDSFEPGVSSCSGSLNVGVVEDTESAVFRFMSWIEPRNAALMGSVAAPCSGFVDEPLKLSYEITENLSFSARIDTTPGGILKHTPFASDNLLFRYALPWT